MIKTIKTLSAQMKQKYQRKWKWIFQRNWYQVILFKKRKRYTPITTPSSVKFRHKIGIQNIILFFYRMTIYTALFYKLRISLGVLTISLLSNFLVVLCFFWGFFFFWSLFLLIFRVFQEHVENTKAKKP